MTTKKRAAVAMLLPSSVRRYFWMGLKAVTAVSVVICVLAFLRISRSASLEESAFSSPSISYTGTPKVAFLFLARAGLPLDFLWHSFFQNGDSEKFSIFIHSAPGFAFDESTTRSSYFYGRQLKQSVQVVWGEASMIEAERLLFQASLEDLMNQRFVLLSDSCIPLYNFSYIYSYVMSSSKSFVDSFIDAKEQRYNPKMSPTISKDKWRKGSQWVTLTRNHAGVVISDGVIFPVFKNHCKRQLQIDPEKKQTAMQKNSAKKQHDCIPDEHYVQTLFSMSALDGELERRTLTYTSWNESTEKSNKKGWHPLTFEFADASPQHIKEIKGVNHVYYETEYRTEWCQSNGTAVPCFLFARKFSKGAAMRLLNDGIVGPYDVAMLLSANSRVSA